MPLADTQRLLHTLQVQMIELEMHNADLQQVADEVEIARNKYEDFYVFAAVGYLTLDNHGMICENNFACAQLLGVGRKSLIDKPFVQLIADADGKSIFLEHLEQVVQSLDFHHKESRKLVNTFGLIVAEDLKIRNMVRHRRLSKSIAAAGWRQFLWILVYKVEEAGCRFEKLPPQYTSITCSGCKQPVPKTL